MAKITTLFLDIGGVLMTNGWDRFMREKAAQFFNLNFEEFEQKHHQFFDAFERDEISFDDYLKNVILFNESNFSLETFKEYVYGQSKPFPDMIAFFSQIKKIYSIRAVAVSNEGREIAEYRIKNANLTSFLDDFFISSFVGYQKPDLHIFKIALDVLQVVPSEVFYIDDRKEHIEAAAKLGIRGVQHLSLLTTREALLKALND